MNKELKNLLLSNIFHVCHAVRNARNNIYLYPKVNMSPCHILNVNTYYILIVTKIGILIDPLH